MIRHATEDDIRDLQILWDESFHDPMDYVDFIYSHVARPADTLVYEQHNRVVSMMTMVPISFVFREKAVKTMYIYGAATDRKYQKQGIMTSMLRYAEDYARRLDFTLSVLVPGEKYLFDYYRRRGYSADFNCRVLKLKSGMIKSELTVDVDSTIDEITPRQFYHIRHETLKEIPHIAWNPNQLQFVFDDLQLYGEHIAYYAGKYGESYAVYSYAKKKMYIKECMGTTNDARQVVIKDLIQKRNPNEIKIQLPVNSQLFDYEGKLTKYGMAKTLMVSASIKDMEPYMNLMLD